MYTHLSRVIVPNARFASRSTTGLLREVLRDLHVKPPVRTEAVADDETAICEQRLPRMFRTVQTDTVYTPGFQTAGAQCSVSVIPAFYGFEKAHML